jgi:nucleotide-binding universal stress UspA family protein
MTAVQFKRIHVALDNSDHSNASVHLGVELSNTVKASLTGSHVYAAKLHDVRFKQMEFTLPDEYKEETELEKQRRIHDALITRGLELISDSYLDQMERMSDELEIDFTRKIFDGRTFEPLVDDLASGEYDLLILGALGQGAVRDSEIGSVCERVLRRTTLDALVVRDAETMTLAGETPIAIALDGSEYSWGALQSGIALAKASNRPIHILAVVGEDDDAKPLIQAHLEMAEEIVTAEGLPVTGSLVESNAPSGVVIASMAAELSAFALAMGRHGLDAPTESPEMGSVVEHVLRRGETNVLVTSRTWNPAESDALNSEIAA